MRTSIFKLEELQLLLVSKPCILEIFLLSCVPGTRRREVDELVRERKPHTHHEQKETIEACCELLGYSKDNLPVFNKRYFNLSVNSKPPVKKKLKTRYRKKNLSRTRGAVVDKIYK